MVGTVQRLGRATAPSIAGARVSRSSRYCAARSTIRSPSASDDVAAGDGALRTNHAVVLCEEEVVDEVAAAADGLRAHAGRPGQRVVRTQLRDEACGRVHQVAAARRHRDLVERRAPPAPRDLVRARPRASV
jgi:hypothetical protein